MRTVKVKFTATFVATLEVPDDATPRQIGEELSDVEIPENEICKYVEDTFEPEVDEDGDPVIFK